MTTQGAAKILTEMELRSTSGAGRIPPTRAPA